MKSWVKIGAVCECHGEGGGILFRVKHLAKGCAYLTSLDGVHHLGWKDLKGCYRSKKCRQSIASQPSATRKLVAEWWEVRWIKGDVNILVAGGWPDHGRRPRDTFASRETALAFKRKEANRYHRVIHVKRYQVVS